MEGWLVGFTGGRWFGDGGDGDGRLGSSGDLTRRGGAADGWVWVGFGVTSARRHSG